MDKNHFDNVELYCRKLGHLLTFDYCRTENSGQLCTKIRDCWFEKIPIDEYLSANYSAEEISRLFKSPKPKVVTLFELIQRAQAVSEKEE
ncbi:MAG: hypothetical protein GXO77_11275 [Calditrichaeota bacterium]|nr:hypothetical protein [Calditrichota bacterium]